MSVYLGYDDITCMSGSWGDYNNDGFVDLYVANPFKEANFLFRNITGKSFYKETLSVFMNDSISSNGSVWLDIDNDGDLDLYVASILHNALYLNSGGGQFTKVIDHVLVDSAVILPGQSCSTADFDNDGDVDILVTYKGTYTHVLFVNGGNTNHWLKLKLTGECSNRSAIGAKVRVKATINDTSYWQLREVAPRSGRGSQSSLIQHFGLGDAEKIDSLIIEWPNGNTCFFHALKTDTMYHFEEMECSVEIIPEEIILEEKSTCAYDDLIISCPDFEGPIEYSWQIFKDESWKNINVIDNISINKNELVFYDIKPELDRSKIRCVYHNYCSRRTITSSETDVIINPCFTLSGTIYTSDNLLDEGLVIIESDENEYWSDTTTVQNGSFLFTNIKEGYYYVKVVPLGLEEFQYYPTYYYKAIDKKKAAKIKIDKNTHELFFLVERECFPTRFEFDSAFISGNVNMDDMLFEGANFGSSIDTLGDLNNDGIMDWIISAPGQVINEDNRGEVFLVFPDENNGIDSIIGINENTVLPWEVNLYNRFGNRVLNIGDLNGDNINEIMVSNPDADSSTGVIYTLFLNQSGKVDSYSVIGRHNTNGIPVDVIRRAGFGNTSICNLGDLDGDGITDIVTGAYAENAIYFVYLNQDGSTKVYHKLSAGDIDGFPGYSSYSAFGMSICKLPDIDGNGYNEIAVSVTGGISGTLGGAIFVLFLDQDQNVLKFEKIDNYSFNDLIISQVHKFGLRMKEVGCLLDASSPCIAACVPGHDYFGSKKGLIMIISLNEDGTMKDYGILQSEDGNFEDQVSMSTGVAFDMMRFDTEENRSLYVGNYTAHNIQYQNTGAIYKYSLCNSEKTIDYITVTGRVMVDDIPVYDAEVYLFAFDDLETPIYTSKIVNGQFVFNNILPGTYKLCVIPLGGYNNKYQKTCFDQEVEIEQAMSLNIGSDRRGIEISLLEKPILDNEEKMSGNEIKCFPNPVNDYLSVYLPLEQEVKSIQLETITGQIVFSKQYQYTQGEVKVPFTSFASGAYVLTVYLSDGTFQSFKVLK